MKTASKILSMLLLVAMCLSLMGGSAYALAPLEGEGTSSGGTTGSGTVSNGGIYGLLPEEIESSNASGSQQNSTAITNGASNEDQTVFGMMSTDAPVLFSSPTDPWILERTGGTYEKLSEVLAAASSGDTIYINNDVVLDASTEISKSVTINLKGHKIDLDGKQLTITNNASVDLTSGIIGNQGVVIANVTKGASLSLHSIRAVSASFSGEGNIDVYGGCTFDDGKDPDPDYMAPGYGSTDGDTKVYEAWIGSTYYPTVADAIKAAKSGDTINCITDTSVSEELNAQNVSISKNLTINLGGNSLNMEGTTINGSSVTISGTRITGALTLQNNATINLSSGLKASTINLYSNSNLYVNGATIEKVRVYGCTVNMSSGTIKSLEILSSDAQLNISGGNVDEFLVSSPMSLPRAITGGQWVVQDGQLSVFESAIANGYEKYGTSPNYTVRKIGDTGGQPGTDGNVKYALYGSPYTHGSMSSVYIDLSELPISTVGFYINTIKSTTGAQQISSSNYTVTNNSYSGYNYRVNFTSSYLNSLANGTYYIITQFNGKNVSTIVGTLVVQGSNNILPGNASVWPVEDVWYSGDGMCYFYVTPGLKLIDGIQYDYYDVAIDGMQIGGDKLSYNGYQKFGVASSVMDTLAPGNHTITVTTTAGPASGTFRVGATLRAVDTDKHVIGSSKNLQFICSGTISRVWVGNSELSNTWNNYYTLSNSGKTITLTADFLNNLTAGNTYTLTVMTTSGDTPSCTFKILTKAQASASPQTGDESSLALWAAVLILSGGAVVAVLPQVKKMRSK